jgi:thiol:disulfide interchange protein DsbC
MPNTIREARELPAALRFQVRENMPEKHMSIARSVRLPTSVLLAVCLLLGWVVGAQAQKESPEATIRGKLKQARPDFNITSVRPSVASGIYEIQLQGGPVLYATADGDFFILGDLFSVGIDGIVNLAEQQRDLERKELIAAVKEEDMIVFTAQGETRGSVTVFTDVDCFYCQKLHLEVPALNEAGIEVRYLAYPREGIGSASYRKIATAWCADNPQQTLTMLKNRQAVPDNVCPGNPVADQYLLGQKVGVRGTPALVLETGEMVPGYMAADDLAARMGVN